MTTVEEEVQFDLSLPWDYFLRETFADNGRLNGERLDIAVAAVRPHIDAFRVGEWKTIKRALAQDYNWEVVDDLEPHWVGPKSAVYWQHSSVMKRHVDEDGNRSLVNVDLGWKPTSPQPANNASHIAHYLNKGFRLRPPSNGVDAKYVEAAASVDAVEEVPEDSRPSFVCKRHMTGKMAFRSWKAYLKHLDYYQESLEYELPSLVVEKIAKFKWFCVVHNKGFNSSSMAERHIREEQRRSGKRPHVGVQDMLVIKGT